MESGIFHTSCLFTKNIRTPVSLNSNQAMGCRFLLPAKRLVHPTLTQKSNFFPRAVCGFCVWFSALCVFGLSPWLFTWAPASQAVPCLAELFLTVDAHRLCSVMYTRSLSAAVLLHQWMVNPFQVTRSLTKLTMYLQNIHEIKEWGRGMEKT